MFYFWGNADVFTVICQIFQYRKIILHIVEYFPEIQIYITLEVV